MSRGSGAGLIRVGNLGGKTIATISSAVNSSPDMTEAFGFRNYTFQLDTGSGSPVGTVDVQGTLDPATAAGTASNWFTIGTLNPANAAQSEVTYDKILKAVRVNGTNWVSGTFVVLAAAVP